MQQGHKQGHTVETRALLVMLATLVTSRKSKVDCKKKTLQLAVDLVRASIESVGAHSCNDGVMRVVVQRRDGPAECRLRFDNAGYTSDMENLMAGHVAFGRRMTQLAEEGWNGVRVGGVPSRCSLWDVLLLCVWSFAHPSDGTLWRDIGQPLYAASVNTCGHLIDRMVVQDLADRTLSAVPVLRTESGNTRRATVSNRILLLQRVKAQKRHRGEVMATHSDITSSGPVMIRMEHALEACLYVQNLAEEFADVTQLQVSWDSSVFDVDTLVACVYSPDSGILDSFDVRFARLHVQGSEL